MRHSMGGIALAVFLCLGFGATTVNAAEDVPAKKAAADKKKAVAAKQVAKQAAAQQAAAAAKRAALVKKLKAAGEKMQAAPAVGVEPLAVEMIFLQNGQALPANQARKQLRQLYKVELAYAHRVCDMSPEQREQVAMATVESIDDFIKKLGKKKNRNARVRGFVNGRATLSVNERATVQAEIKKLVDTKLRPEQAALYLDEITKRDQRFRQATVQFFVARIDEKLRLTDEQRAKLLKALEDKWREQYGQTVEVLMNNPRYVPQVSSGPLMAILDDYQKSVWRTLQKLGPQNVSIFGRGGANDMVDDFELPDDEVKAKHVEGGDDVLIEGGVDVLN
jgi:hypothetical protein